MNRKDVLFMAVLLAISLVVSILMTPNYQFGWNMAKMRDDKFINSEVNGGHTFKFVPLCLEWDAPGYFNYKTGLVKEIEDYSYQLGYFTYLSAKMDYLFVVNNREQKFVLPWQVGKVQVICDPGALWIGLHKTY
jgi:hypothetical protein